MFSPYALGYLLLSLIVISIVISIRWAATRKLSPLGCASAIIVLVLVLSIYFKFFAAPPEVVPGPSPSSLEIAKMSTSQLSIVAGTYSHFQRDSSVDVYVLIIPLSPPVASASPTPNQTQIATRVTPVGTPDVVIEKAFGPNYDASAVAQLSGSAFDIDPKEPQKQSLNQSGRVTFIWTVLPKLPGKQTLIVSVTGLWVPKSGGTPIERPLGELVGHVNVEQSTLALPSPPPSFFSSGELHLSDILMLILGSVLNVQWIWGLVQEARKKGKEKQEAPSQRSAQFPPNRRRHKRHQ